MATPTPIDTDLVMQATDVAVSETAMVKRPVDYWESVRIVEVPVYVARPDKPAVQTAQALGAPTSPVGGSARTNP